MISCGAVLFSPKIWHTKMNRLTFCATIVNHFSFTFYYQNDKWWLKKLWTIILSFCTCTRALHIYNWNAKNDTHAHSNKSKQSLLNDDTRHFHSQLLSDRMCIYRMEVCACLDFVKMMWYCCGEIANFVEFFFLQSSIQNKRIIISLRKYTSEIEFNVKNQKYWIYNWKLQ